MTNGIRATLSVSDPKALRLKMEVNDRVYGNGVPAPVFECIFPVNAADMRGGTKRRTDLGRMRIDPPLQGFHLR